MQFDRAMALLLAGYKVRRPSWARDDGSTHLKLAIYGEQSHVIREGTEVRFTRTILVMRDGGLGGGDLGASDWEVVPGETPTPVSRVMGGDES